MAVDRSIVTPRDAFERWERGLDTWVREALRCYCKRHQERGELFEPGFSGRAVAAEEIDKLLQPLDPESEPELGPAFAARDARMAMWAALRNCDEVLDGRLLWTHLQRRFALADDELELVLLTYVATCAPSLQRALRFAWNDFGRRLPPAAFLWELARPERGETGLDRLADIMHLSSIFTYQLVEQADPYPSTIFSQLRIHPNVVATLGIAERAALGNVRRVIDPGPPAEMVPDWDDTLGPRTWLLIGPSGSGRTALALDRAERLGYRLVSCEMTEQIGKGDASAALAFARACVRDAALLGAALHIEKAHHLQAHAGLLDAVLDALIEAPIPVSLALLAAPSAVTAIDKLRITQLAPPDRDRRLALWTDAVGAMLRPAEVLDLASRYPLTNGQIRRAVREAEWRHQQPFHGDRPRARADLLHEEARNVLHRDVQILATPVVTRLSWNDLVLPDETRDQLWDVVRYVRHRRQVFDEWNFAAKFDYGTAVTALLTGPPGTGKTMASALIARELGLELYRVALPQIVSKWVGETEKNIDKIFEFSERHGVALLFDEADSLFGKRATVESAADRYANMETNFLLQRLEQFEGVAFLTTNLAKGLDEAFERRLRFRIEFPEPDAEMRLQLWRSMIPPSALVAPSIDFKWLAETFELSGAHIKEAVLTAAFLAAEQKTPITIALLCLGANGQYRKMGKLATAKPPR